LRSDGGGGAADGNVREVYAWAWGDHCWLLVFVNVEGIRDISCIKKSRASHVCTAPSEVNDGNGRRG
jgi:hypothetical protein